jgi:hypothetical protein
VDPRTGLDPVEKNILTLPVIEPRFLGRPVRNLVGISTELSRTEESSEKPHDSCSPNRDLNPGPLEYYTIARETLPHTYIYFSV